ncbi:MAG TPA: hypothetical protein VIF88_03020 [Methylocystis sp.]|jgi:hypothetical protein
MTNVYGSPEKVSMKTQLFNIAVEALQKAGWKVERVQGSGKSSVRRIIKGSQSKVVSIRTTQDTWIAFPRVEGDKGWRTLDEVDAVVPVSVDDRHNPKFAKVHLIDGDEMRDRFNRAYVARKKAGHSIPIGRGVWVSLYLPEAQDPVSHIGAGAGLKFPPIATVPLTPELVAAIEVEKGADERETHVVDEIEEAPLSIAQAKRRLAKTLGVDAANIKITVEA